MTPKDYEIQTLRRENKRLADELSKAMVGLVWLRGKYEEVEAQAQKLPVAEIKAAEIGILTYLSLADGQELNWEDDDITINAPVNLNLLKAALRICMIMDMDSVDLKFNK